MWNFAVFSSLFLHTDILLRIVTETCLLNLRNRDTLLNSSEAERKFSVCFPVCEIDFVVAGREGLLHDFEVVWKKILHKGCFGLLSFVPLCVEGEGGAFQNS